MATLSTTGAFVHINFLAIHESPPTYDGMHREVNRMECHYC